MLEIESEYDAVRVAVIIHVQRKTRQLTKRCQAVKLKRSWARYTNNKNKNTLFPYLFFFHLHITWEKDVQKNSPRRK